MNFRKILALTVSVIVLLSCLAFNVSAVSATISLSSSSPSVGEKVTASVNIQGTELYAAALDVSYNPSVLRFESSSDQNNGSSASAGSVKIVPAIGVVLNILLQ